MRGRMMAFPLTVPALLRRTETFWRNREVVSREPDRSVVRTTYGATLQRARRLAVALRGAGIRSGDRVATLCWNHLAHLEAYFGIPLAGAVVHTLNLRLHPGDLGYITAHAEDSAIIVDASLVPLLVQFRERIPRARVIVVGASASEAEGLLPGAIDYESFIAGADPDHYADEITDEHAAAAMCYTSGTTGRPKGVLYSHYSICLHAAAVGQAFALHEHDTILPVVAMFHANAWGLPYTSAILGAKFVLPGPFMDPASVLELLSSERATFAAGVPTIWAGIAQALETAPGRYDLSSLKRILCGGSAVPPSMIETYERKYGVRIFQAWGMTETSPLATVANVETHFEGLTPAERYTLAAKQGWAVPNIELRVMTPDGEAPRDGTSMGEIEVRGPWVISGYYKDDAPDRFSPDGWFRTGDIATLDETGCVQIQDRAKDLIKSGGEWISSVALESALVAHPAVAEAAVVAILDERWQERPLALVVLRPGAAVTAGELHSFLAPQFAKWWLPDGYAVVDSLPRTPTGKLLKYELREKYKDYKALQART
jgi:acyl-CoA synthetase (AMP-forming)/AMP-acid ligase II